jgi:hypothetical protein
VQHATITFMSNSQPTLETAILSDDRLAATDNNITFVFRRK